MAVNDTAANSTIATSAVLNGTANTAGSLGTSATVATGLTATSTGGSLTSALGAGIGADVTTAAATDSNATGGTAVVDILAGYGVTLDQAQAFWTANEATPQTIYDTAQHYGLGFAELGEISGQSASEVQTYIANADLGTTITALASIGLTQVQAGATVNAALEAGNTQQVLEATQALNLDIDTLAEVSGQWSVDQLQNTFVNAGLDPADIGGAPADEVGVALLPPTFGAAGAGVLAFNNQEGDLSTASLREAVLDLGVSQEDYDAHFDASVYVGAADGTLSTDDLGFDTLGSFEASNANIESLYYGSTIAGLGAVDTIELSHIGEFLQDHLGALQDGDALAVQAYAELIVNAVSTPSDEPAVAADELAPLIAATTAASIGLVGSGGADSVFDPTQWIPTVA